MKGFTRRIVVALLAGVLVACGGGGDGGAGGGAGSGNSGNNGGGGSFASAGAHVEESDPAVSLSAGWTAAERNSGWSAGAAVKSNVAGATASFTFTGNSVRWIGRFSRDGGIARVRVDGRELREVNLFARVYEVRTPVLTLYDLGDGPHTLTIEVTGNKDSEADSNEVVVDAFEVEPQILSHLQETDPAVSFNGKWDADHSGIWSGGGVFSEPDPPFGGARVANGKDANVTLRFRGTSVGWIGYRGPDGGIARLRVDGGQAIEVDTYSPTQKIQELLFTAGGLADADHTLTIEATGRRNPASTGTKIVVDAFDVTRPGRRYQEWDPAISYAGTWVKRNANRVWSEGATRTTQTPGSKATFTFTGTSVAWIGVEKSSIGRANVYLDGAFVKEVNMYRQIPIEIYQQPIFSAEGLTPGTHTLTIEGLSSNAYVAIDAFDVYP